MRIVCTEMQVTRMTISILLLIVALTAVNGGYILTRQNFGYVLKQVDKKFLISGNVKFIFHFKVPQIVVHFDHEPLNCSHHNDYAAHQKCMHFRGSVHAIYDLYQDMANVLYGRLTEAREMLLQLPLYQPSRQTRSFSSWLLWDWQPFRPSDD